MRLYFEEGFKERFSELESNFIEAAKCCMLKYINNKTVKKVLKIITQNVSIQT
jgi:hypothetical protein